MRTLQKITISFSIREIEDLASSPYFNSQRVFPKKILNNEHLLIEFWKLCQYSDSYSVSTCNIVI